MLERRGVIEGVETARIIAAVLAILLAGSLLAFSPKIAESINAPSLKLVSFEENPQFLWINRGLDLLIQAFIILAAAAAISAQFRREEPRREVEER